MKAWVFAALASASVLAAASQASAAKFIHLNPHTSDGSITGVFGDTGAPKAGTFTDTFKFWLPSRGDTTASISTSATKTCNAKTKKCTINPATNLDFLSATLDGHPFTLSPTGQFEFGSIDLDNKTGWQTLSVTYKSYGKGPSYSGTIDFSPTPEPAAWAFMILGFGAIGAALRAGRRDPLPARAA